MYSGKQLGAIDTQNVYRVRKSVHYISFSRSTIDAGELKEQKFLHKMHFGKLFVVLHYEIQKNTMFDWKLLNINLF